VPPSPRAVDRFGPLAEGAAVIAAQLVSRAHAEHAPTWVDPELFVAHAVERAEPDNPGAVERLSSLHAADLYLALACAAGVPEAIARFDRDHLSRVGDFVARVDDAAPLVEELTQRLRTRLLVATEDGPARILTYSARSPLGGWLRVCAVREARELVGKQRRSSELPDLAADVDPELAWLKERYGPIVSEAFARALGTLTGDERTMLRLHYVDGASIGEVGTIFRVSRATAARALARASARVVDTVRQELEPWLGTHDGAMDSLLAFVRSRIELDLARHLGPPETQKKE
jgi:RNA polymerase sigma-70 factor, ECF subfamily